MKFKIGLEREIEKRNTWSTHLNTKDKEIKINKNQKKKKIKNKLKIKK
jgi:hypothetical protein